MRASLPGLTRAALAVLVIGVLCGLGGAGFLHALAWVTATREANPALLFVLPLAGVALVLGYDRWGGAARGGTRMVVHALRDDAVAIPVRIAPMIVAGTLVTHLFGGSAGREGTAVQMGAGLAEAALRLLQGLKLPRALALACGVAGGFGAVFGTPLAGALFAIEAGRSWRIALRPLLPALATALLADAVTRALGGTHTAFPRWAGPVPTVTGLVQAVALGLTCGLAARAFVYGLGFARAQFARLPALWMRPLLGGALVVALALALDNREPLGLSIPLALRATQGGDVAAEASALKALFTILTLGSGFLGGEVTPLFVIGATLGHALAPLLGADRGALAMLGFVAVFAGASRAPLACALMGIELFGGGAPSFAAACMAAAVLPGRNGLYD